jgi:hypothetical protein
MKFQFKMQQFLSGKLYGLIAVSGFIFINGHSDSNYLKLLYFFKAL